jgi:hypothetical protein
MCVCLAFRRVLGCCVRVGRRRRRWRRSRSRRRRKGKKMMGGR